MKKILSISIFCLMMIMSVLTLSSQALSLNITTDKDIVKKDEEIILKIQASEKSIATNFNINYDSSMFELVGSVTDELNVAKKDDIIACIYADVMGDGIDTFEVKFRAIKDNKKSKFSITNVKMATSLEDESISGNEIEGSQKEVEVKGKNCYNIIIIISVILVLFLIALVVFKNKNKEVKN